MNWFWRKPKPPEYRTYGCYYNLRRQRWELCGAEAQLDNTKLYLVEVGPIAERQASILGNYDAFQQMLRSKVELGQ